MTTILKGMGFEPSALCMTKSYCGACVQSFLPCCEWENCCTECCTYADPSEVNALLRSGWEPVRNFEAVETWESSTKFGDTLRRVTLKKTCSTFEKTVACPTSAACSLLRPTIYAATFLPLAVYSGLGSLICDCGGCLDGCSWSTPAAYTNVNGSYSAFPVSGTNGYVPAAMHSADATGADRQHRMAEEVRGINCEYYKFMGLSNCEFTCPESKFKYLTIPADYGI